MSEPCFDAMLKHDMVERNQRQVMIEDINSEVFDEFIRFIYTGKVNKIENIAGELLTVAEKYSVHGLKAMCEDAMCNSINEDNAMEYLVIADINNAEKPKVKIIKVDLLTPSRVFS